MGVLDCNFNKKGAMKPTLLLLMVLTALTHGKPQKTPEARNAETDEATWELRFKNGTTVHGAGTPPEIWMKQPVEEKEETKDIKKTKEGNLIEEKEGSADSPDFPDDEKIHNGERQWYTTR